MSEYRTTEDGAGCNVLVESFNDHVWVTVGSLAAGEAAEIDPADRAALAAAILGWPVDQVTRVNPATHVVVERRDLDLVLLKADEHGLVGHPNYRLRAALVEGGAR